jgi:flagellar biosynthesis protein FlhB
MIEIKTEKADIENLKEMCKDLDDEGDKKDIFGNYEDNIINILIDFIKDELLKSNIRFEIVKPILIYMLYYLIPFIILIIFLNFIATIFAVYIVFKFLL